MRREGPVLRGLARLVIRGPDARFILDDLDELYARDRAQGLSPLRAWMRYVANASGSAWSVARASWHWPRLPGLSALDVKLAARMLVKHPALTVVSCLALAIGIPVGLAPLQLVSAVNRPLPVDEGERILGLEYWNLAAFDEAMPTLHDFAVWRTELRSFEKLAAVRTFTQNVIEPAGGTTARGAELTASAFEVLRVRPQLGRMLVEADEARGAEPVVVISHDLWQSVFAGDARVLGRTLQLGRTRRTVVGVMPADFLFPFRDRFWVPLTDAAEEHAPRAGASYTVFGRLRAGVTRAEAQRELTNVAARMAAAHPETHARLRADVLPFGQALVGLRTDGERLLPVQLAALLLLAVTCGNVGTLMLARTARRTGELAMRSALGASRGRILAQLFLESLVLALLAAGAGLLLAHLVIRRLDPLLGSMPYWFDFGIRPGTVAAACALAAFSAVIAGVVPGIRATSRGVFRNLQRAGAGATGVRFGMLSTVLVIAEVALAVGCLSVVGATASSALRATSIGAGVQAHEYLAAPLRLRVEAEPGSAATDPDSFAARLATTQTELARRLAAEPQVRAVAYASALPGMDHPPGFVEVEGLPVHSTGRYGTMVRYAAVDVEFFGVLDQAPLAGRTFVQADLRAGARPVVVNQSFVEQVLRGTHAPGTRIRYVHPVNGEPGEWYEIVGVVNDLGMNVVNPDHGAGVYHVAAPGSEPRLQLLMRLRGDAADFAPRLRELVLAVEPAMLVGSVQPLDRMFSELRFEARFGSFLFAVLGAIAIMLSAAGLYALMSFTVAERTREIGIRTALGAHPLRVVYGVLTRAFVQVGAGVVAGAVLGAMLIADVTNSTIRSTAWPFMLAGIAVAMTCIGLLACAPATLRALRIQPVQALRENR